MAKEILERPVLKIKATSLDYFFEIIAALVLIATWIYAATSYNELPEKVASHFGFNGEPDAYAGKSSIWALPTVASLLWMLLTIVNQFPHAFNFPYQLTEENVERQYRMAQRFMRIMKILISCIFLFAVHSVVMASTSTNFNMKYSAPIIIGSLFIFIVLYFYISKKKK
jgi:uncharacterized membrane protein